jgi:hypothetical protein
MQQRSDGHTVEAVGWGNALQARRSGFVFWWGYWIFSTYLILAVALWPGSLHSLEQKWGTGISLWRKVRTARKAANLIIFEPIFYKMRDSRRLKTLKASRACYRENVTIFQSTCMQRHRSQQHASACCNNLEFCLNFCPKTAYINEEFRFLGCYTVWLL